MIRGFQQGYGSKAFKIKELSKPIKEEIPYDELKG
jgi:hypothetical protein